MMTQHLHHTTSITARIIAVAAAVWAVTRRAQGLKKQKRRNSYLPYSRCRHESVRRRFVFLELLAVSFQLFA